METLNVLAQIEQEKVGDKSSDMNHYFYNVKYKNLKNIDKEMDKITNYIFEKFGIQSTIINIEPIKLDLLYISKIPNFISFHKNQIDKIIYLYIYENLGIFINKKLNTIKNNKNGINQTIDIREIFEDINKKLENCLTISFIRKG